MLCIKKDGHYRRVTERAFDVRWQKLGYEIAEEPKPEPSEAKTVDQMTVPELQAYAKENGIDLGEATRKADILAVIQAAESDNEGDE